VKEHDLLGAHMSIAGGVSRSVGRATDVGCQVLQIFVKNASQWKGKELSEEEVDAFQRQYRDSGLESVVGHDSYLINLASPDPDLWERSIAAFVDEMERSDRLGLDYLVTHPGAHMGEGEPKGVDRVVAAFEEIFDRLGETPVKVAVETTAGQGTTLGHRFEHLRDILAGCSQPERMAVCLDTCHVFAAGYELRSSEGCEATFDEFDRVIGLDQLRVLHVNDSKREFGSRVDRHDHIGDGQIGLDGFSWIMNNSAFSSIPKILETPKGKDGEYDQRNLATLRSLVNRNDGK
jgi:deoxyribonuclease-4